MTVEAQAEDTQVALPEKEPTKLMEETVKVVEGESAFEAKSKPETVEKSSSYREESNFLSDLKEHEMKALIELKSKIEECILKNNFFMNEEQEKASKGGGQKEEKVVKEQEKEEKTEAEGDKGGDKTVEEEAEETEKPVADGKSEVDTEIALWGVPLLPSKGAEGTDVILLKFLRARDLKVDDAFAMLKKTLKWRKGWKMDSILDEDLGTDLASVAYMDGIDREGHPVCYNNFGAFDDEELYQKTFGSEENREKFLRWRFQLMEKGIQKLNFKPAGVSSLLQINDLKNCRGPLKKELRVATKQAIALLQDNYPELVAKNILINVPFWYYAFNALLSPFLTQRTKSKFVVIRPSKVTETLLKYIPAEEIPVQYGGFKRENDFDFSMQDGFVSELIVKSGSTRTIEIPTPDVGPTTIWDLTVLGWEIKYKEEFVPSDEGSYTVIIQKGKKISSNEAPIRNSFRNNEPGNVVLTIANGSSKKKRILYRYKTKKNCSS